MPDPDDPLDDLAEEYAARLRAGELPDPEEFAARHPERAGEVREMLSGVLLMERLKPVAPPPRPAPPSERLGEYRILRELGRGGMGVVYEAIHAPLGRRVALKVLAGRRTDDPADTLRFEREARAAARLHHTHIVPVFDVGEADGHRYYAMQLITGRPLDRLPVADFATAARLIADAADALDYAHQQGVLHRDVKPGNLLVDDAGQVWVTDFGVAKVLEDSSLTMTGEVVGTLRYMPPERFAGVSDARGDVYALGVSLYEALTGRPAFPDVSATELVKLITQSAPVRPRSLVPTLPRDLETVVLTATARDPAHRYQTAAALATDLRRFLDDRPVLARRTGPLGQLWRWSRRNPALATATGIAAGLLLAVAGVSSAAWAYTAAARHAEATQRRRAEQTTTLALDALNRVYERFAPARLVVAPPAGPLDDPRPAVLPPALVPVLEDLLATYKRIADEDRDTPALAARVAEADHRMGDLHGLFGRHEEAVAAYRAALATYSRLPADGVRVRRARACNECGRRLSELHRTADARQMHEQAVELLADVTVAPPALRYELACAYAALDRKDMLRDAPPDGPPPGEPGGPPPVSTPHGPRAGEPPGSKGGPPPRTGDRTGTVRGTHPPPPPDGFGDGPPPLPPGGFGDRPPPPPPGGFGDRPPPPPDGEHGPPPRGFGGLPGSRAIELLDGLVAEAPTVPEYRHLLASCLGEQPGAEGRAVDLLRALVRDFPAVPDYRFDLCQTLVRPGPGDRDRRHLREAVELAAGLAADYPQAPGYAALHARVLDKFGGVLFDDGAASEAEAVLRQAVGIQTALTEKYPAVGAYRVWRGMMERALARPMAARGALPEARRLLEAGVTRVEKELAADPSLAGVRPFLGMALAELADVQERQGDIHAAAATRKRATAADGR